MTDQELHIIIKGCIDNDRRCQEFLYKHYYKTMMAIVTRYIECPFIAEEVLNNGYLRIFKGLNQYTYSGSFEGWMKKIMFRAVAEAVKSDSRITTAKKREKGKFLEKSFEVKYDSKDGYEIFTAEPASHDNNHLEEQDIWKLIDTLPNVTGKVFKMYLDGYLHREIADLLEMNVGTSKWHVNQARNLLKLRVR